jgi:hypothetical protein
MMLGEIRPWRPQGTPEGVTGVELPARDLRALHIPRANIHELGPDTGLDGYGVYFLTAPTRGPGLKPRAFLGAAPHLLQQLEQMDRSPPVPWRAAVAIPVQPPRVPRFHKELTKLVQFHCHRWAAQAGMYEIASTEPACPSLVPAVIERDLKAQRSAIQTLLVALRHPVLGNRADGNAHRAMA